MALLISKPDDEQKVIKVGPQEGPQTAFLETIADIAFYGGAAGGGKSYALLLEPLRHYDNPKFGSVIFRRNATQIRVEGGLWDESLALYTGLGGYPVESFLTWDFPSGSRLKFAHLEYDKSVYDYHGSQIPFIGFDEVTLFTEKQFWYMLSRNRSTSGVPAYMRATCNPDADSWVRKLIDWYIGPDGYAIKERSGIIRWFVRINDELIWGQSREEIFKNNPEISINDCKSFTFIPSRLSDNKILMQKDPRYIANLRAMNRVDRLRLEGGNWNIRATAGTLFQREWFPVIDAIPAGWISACRFWDRAATKPNEGNKDPDWTRGIKLYKYPNGTFVVTDLRSMRDSPAKVENLILTTASHDSSSVKIKSQQDPGSAGVSEAQRFVTMLAGYNVETETLTGDKVTRAKPVSAQSEVGNIKVLRAPWNDEFFTELENFPDGGHDDIVDVLSGAFNELAGGMSLADVL